MSAQAGQSSPPAAEPARERAASPTEPARARTARPGGAGRRRVRRFVPPQHGAWAMLLLPYLASVLVVGPRWPQLPLLGAWLAGYLFSYYALQSIKTRRPGRFRDQLIWYGSVAGLLGAVVVVASPRVLLFAPGYALLLAVNAGYAWRRRERALLNDLASVVQSCLMVFVVAVSAGTAPAEVTGVFLAVLGYFAGTVWYVKTMIRERGSVGYRRASIGYHLLALAGAVLLGPLVAVVFALLLVRAWVLPGRGLAPKWVGMIEIANCVLLLVATTLTWG